MTHVFEYDVHPVWDEGEDWPDAWGTPVRVEAVSRQEAEALGRAKLEAEMGTSADWYTALRVDGTPFWKEQMTS